MPRLESAFRRHHIGSDDLTLPAAVESILYIIWLVWFVKRPTVNGACFDSYLLLRNFNVYGFILVSSGLLLSIQILCTSLKGTVINATPRQRMGTLVLLKLILDVFMLGVIFLSTVSILFHDFSTCDPLALWAMKWSIGLSWVIAVAVSINIWHWMLPPLRMLDRACFKFISSNIPAEKKQNLWRRFGFDDHSVLNGVVELLLNLFKERVDVVPTDLLVSLILLEKEQSHSLSSSCPKSSAEESSPSTRPLWMNTSLARHYLRFATGSFGWPMYLFSGSCAIPRLIRYILRKGLPSRQNLDQVFGDNRWMTNTLVIQMLTGLSSEEIVYISFYNMMFEIPFFVAIDRTQKSIVVSIRGSLSVHDVLMDLSALESEKFSFNDSDMTGFSSHDGMLTAAKKLKCKLLGTDEHGVVIEEGLLSKADTKLKNLVGQASASEYKLVITGHSLGAGVASVLSMLLYQREEYQNLQCFAFSPPGGLLSLSAAAYSEKFVFCVVLGDDIVARLGVRSVFDLKYRVLKILQNCDIPKHAVVGGWLQEKLIAMMGRQTQPMNDTRGPNLLTWAHDEVATTAVAYYQSHLQEAIDSTRAERDKHSRLFLPGCVMHITESAASRWLPKRAKIYMPHWCSRSAPVFNEIVLSPNVVYHHSPHTLLRVLNSLVEDNRQ